MQSKVNKQQFIQCYCKTHPSDSNRQAESNRLWVQLLLKYKLFSKSKSKWPQSFHDEARQLMNKWKERYNTISQIILNKNRKSTVSLNIDKQPQSLQLLVKWVQNIEFKHPNVIDLNFNELKDDITNNVIHNNEAMKFFYACSLQGYHEMNMSQHNPFDNDTNKQQIELNSRLWCGYESVIHYIFGMNSILFPITKPDIKQKQQKMNKLTNDEILLCMK
eukprot:215997_1